MYDVSTHLEDLPDEQRTFLIDFLRNNFRRIEGFNQKHSAYALKQPFTRTYFYVTQEQFAQAMREAGFMVSVNAKGVIRFNISERSPYFKAFRQL